MPSYSFVCKSAKCGRETIIFCRTSEYVDSRYVSCSFCGEDVTLITFCFVDDSKLIELQEKLRDINERVEILTEIQGVELIRKKDLIH